MLEWRRADMRRRASTNGEMWRAAVRSFLPSSCPSVRSPEIKVHLFTAGRSGGAGRLLSARRSPANRRPLPSLLAYGPLTGFARYNTQLRARQDLLPVRTVDSGDARGPRWGTGGYLGGALSPGERWTRRQG